MLAKQGEADLIIDLIEDYSLRSLLPRGTKTWQNGNCKIIINLILVSNKLASIIVKYTVYRTEYRFNYKAIKIVRNNIIYSHVVVI